MIVCPVMADVPVIPTCKAFPFGYGLDYLDVSYTNCSVTVASTTATIPITVHVELQNGPKSQTAAGGSKVVQIYFTPPVSPSRLTRYRHMLGGFAKVRIGAAGATAAVDVPIPATNLAHWVPRRNGHVVDSGEYRLRL